MNEKITTSSLTTYDELKAEEMRLKELLQLKKVKIQGDIAALKAELNPVLKIARVVGDFMSEEKQNHKVAHAGTNLTIDLLAKKFLPKGSFLLNLFLPKLVKNYTSHYVDKVVDKAAPALRRFGTKLTDNAKKA